MLFYFRPSLVFVIFSISLSAKHTEIEIFQFSVYRYSTTLKS